MPNGGWFDYLKKLLKIGEYEEPIEERERRAKETLGAIGRAPFEFLEKGAMPWFEAAGAFLTAPIRPRPEPEEPWKRLLPTSYLPKMPWGPAGKELEAYREWKEPTAKLPLPSWEEWDEMLGLAPKKEGFEAAELGVKETAEFVPWLAVGLGRISKPMYEKLSQQATKYIAGGATTEEALAKATTQLAKKGELPVSGKQAEKLLERWKIEKAKKPKKPPVPVVEAVPEVAPKVAPEALAGVPIEMKAKLPHTLPKIQAQPTPTRITHQASKVADELATDMGKAPIEFQPIVKATIEKNPLQRMMKRGRDFIFRTYRVEPMLEMFDGFASGGKYAVAGGKFSQTFWIPVNEAKTKALAGYSRQVEGLRGLAKFNKIDLGGWLTAKTTVEGIELTTSERIGIYLHRQNADNFVHMVFGNNIPATTVDKVVAGLSVQEKMIGDYLAKSIQGYSYPLQQAVRYATGKVMPIVEKYFPIRVTQKGFRAEVEFNQLLMDEVKLKAISRHAATQVRKGFTLPRTGKGMQPINLDALAVFLEHTRQVEHYINFMPVVQDLAKVLRKPVLKASIIKNYGDAAWDVLDRWVLDVAKTNPLAVPNWGEAAIRTLRGNAVVAALGLNITTAMKQFPSFLSAGPEVGELNLLKGLINSLKHPKQTSQLIKELSPQINARTIERELAEAQTFGKAKRALTGKMTKRELFLIFTTTMDKIAVKGIWRGAFDDAVSKGIAPAEAARYAERAIRRTQPFFDIKDIPELWRSTEMLKALTIFTNQLNQYFNYYAFHIMGKRAAKKIGNLETLRRAIEVIIVPGLMIGAISRSRPAQDAKEALIDIAGMGAATFPLLGSWISGAIRGWYGGQGLITTEVLSQIQEMAYHATRGTWDKALLTMPELAAYLGGIPANQPRRTIQALLEIAQGKSDDWLSLIWGTYTRGKAGAEEGVESLAEKLEKARKRFQPTPSGVRSKEELQETLGKARKRWQ